MGTGVGPSFGNTAGSLDIADWISRYERNVSPEEADFAKKVKAVKMAFNSNGTITEESIRENVDAFCGKGTDVYVAALESIGYKVNVRKSSISKSGAVIVEVKNMSKERNVSQIQVSPGGGRHGNLPYVKISTTNSGIFKIVDGSESDYNTVGNEKATILFRR